MESNRLFPSLLKGLSYGLTSGVITTIGLIIGIYFSTHSFVALIAGIISVAIADSMSDALGIHISEESEKKTDTQLIWTATVFTFFTKAIVASSFLLPFLILTLTWAFIVSLGWGGLLLSLISYYLAKQEKINPFLVIGEHLTIAVLVVIATYLAGILINRLT